MTTRSPLLRHAALMLTLILTIGFAQWFTTTMSHGAAATDSPLPTPWPTVVVTYQATLPTAIPTIAATATAVASNFFRSPLPTPTGRASIRQLTSSSAPKPTGPSPPILPLTKSI